MFVTQLPFDWSSAGNALIDLAFSNRVFGAIQLFI